MRLVNWESSNANSFIFPMLHAGDRGGGLIGTIACSGRSTLPFSDASVLPGREALSQELRAQLFQQRICHVPRIEVHLPYAQQGHDAEERVGKECLVEVRELIGRYSSLYDRV